MTYLRVKVIFVGIFLSHASKAYHKRLHIMAGLWSTCANMSTVSKSGSGVAEHRSE